jgi:ATP-binding cassette subfamily B protein
MQAPHSEASPLPSFTAVCEELLRSGQQIRFRALGNSMEPVIWGGDEVVLSPVAPAYDLRVGDIVLAQVTITSGNTQHWVLHRIESILGNALGTSQERITLSALNSSRIDRVMPEEILGRLVDVIPQAAQQTRPTWKDLARSTQLPWRVAPRRSALWLLCIGLASLAPLATAWALKHVVDGFVPLLGMHAGAQAGTQLSTQAWSSHYPALGWFLGAVLMTALLQTLARFVRTHHAEQVQVGLMDQIHQQSAQIGLGYFERAGARAGLQRARIEAEFRALAHMEQLGSLLQNGILLLGFSVVLLQFGIPIVGILLLGSLPTLAVALAGAREQYLSRERSTQLERRAYYYDHLLSAADAAIDVRLLGLGPWIRARYRSFRRALFSERMRLLLRRSTRDAVATLTGLAAAALAGAVVFAAVLRGERSAGELALFAQAMLTLTRNGRALWSEVGQLLESTLHMTHLLRFIALRDTPFGTGLSPTQTTAHLQGEARGSFALERVAFRYPGSETRLFEDLTLQLPARGLVVLAGQNGAGKSTLFKLLARLYDPSRGQIFLEGVPLDALPIPRVRQQIAMLAQQPLRFQGTLLEGITLDDSSEFLGPLEQEPTSEVLEQRTRRLERALHASNLHALVERLPEGIDTPIGTWFPEGCELSPGEWQRVAMARALYTERPILLLDEPTAALDPLSESLWVEELQALLHDPEWNTRLAVVISHRMAVAHAADEVIVLEQGRVIAQGDPQVLSQHDGPYRRLLELDRNPL